MTSRPLRVFLCHSSNDKPAVREADELYQKLRAVPQGDDKPWIQPWLAFGAKKNSTQGRIRTLRSKPVV